LGAAGPLFNFYRFRKSGVRGTLDGRKNGVAAHEDDLSARNKGPECAW